MKITKDSINLVEKHEKDHSYISKVAVFNEEFYFYYKRVLGSKGYQVYSLSENQYQDSVLGKRVPENQEELIGSMRVDQDEVAWLLQMHKKKKIFGKAGKNRELAQNIKCVCFRLLCLSILGIGIAKLCYYKQFDAIKEVAEGRVTYTNETSFHGRVTRGYYNLQVEYSVDGKCYEASYGSTKTKFRPGQKIMVCYDPKHPEKPIDKDSLKEGTMLFIMAGIALNIFPLFRRLLALESYLKEKRKRKSNV